MDIAAFEALVNSANNESIKESRAQSQAEATCPISDEEQGIIEALRDPGKREKLLAVKAGKDG